MKRFYEKGVIYNLTSVTKNRMSLFLRTDACEFLIKCFEYQKYILAFKLFGFIIMPDHIHCLILPSEDSDISVIMKHLKGNFARKYNWIHATYGSLWQRRYYDTGIRGMLQMVSTLNYIHNNPVRAGLVTSPKDYRFSSYQYYYGNSYRGLIDQWT